MTTYNSALHGADYIVRKVQVPPISPPTQGQLWPRGDKKGA